MRYIIETSLRRDEMSSETWRKVAKQDKSALLSERLFCIKRRDQTWVRQSSRRSLMVGNNRDEMREKRETFE